MPRYVFHTHPGADVIADPAGVAPRDPDAAWETACALIRSAMAETRDPAGPMASTLVVTDGAGDVVLECPFSEALPSSADDATAHRGTSRGGRYRGRRTPRPPDIAE